MASERVIGGSGAPQRVVRTGIALVRRGELVYPSPESEAELEQASQDPSSTIQYMFPVEIEVLPTPVLDADDVADRALARLAESLRSE